MNASQFVTSRRSLLVAGGGLAAMAVMPGCSSGSDKGAGAAGGTLDPASILPIHKANDLVKATQKGDGTWVEDLYLGYPKQLTQSVKEVPGKGSTFRVTTCYWGQPIEKGSHYYKTLNKALGATLNHSDVSSADYTTKLTATLAAGKDLPDVMSCMAWSYPPKLNDALKSAFVNLSEVLGGDKVTKYPNLANLPEIAWKGGLFQNQLYAYPGYLQHTIPLVPYYRKDMWDKVGITEVKGKDQFLDMCKEMTVPGKQQYALTGNLQALVLRFMCGMHFDDMDTDDNGKVQMYWEREDYPDTLEFMRTLAKSYVHPDLLGGTGDAQTLFKAGKVTMLADGAESFLAANDLAKPEGKSKGFRAAAWLPTDLAGKPATFKAGPPVMFANFISKKVQGEKLDELLGILNYLAAPFGTKEWELVHYGTEGTEFKRVDGGPDARHPSIGDAFMYTAAAPMAIYAWGNEGLTSTAQEYYDWQKKMAPNVKFLKTSLVHPKLTTRLESWKKDLTDLESAIIRGQKPLSAFPPALKTWKERYGDSVREAYQKALDESPIKD